MVHGIIIHPIIECERATDKHLNVKMPPIAL